MDLANQTDAKNPLEDDFCAVEPSNMKVLNNEYAIQLDSETMKYFAMKKKAPLSVSHEEEMRKKKKEKTVFIH